MVIGGGLFALLGFGAILGGVGGGALGIVIGCGVIVIGMRNSKPSKACTACQSSDTIPADTPAGREMINAPAPPTR